MEENESMVEHKKIRWGLCTLCTILSRTIIFILFTIASFA